jgi:hypothetical protein
VTYDLTNDELLDAAELLVQRHRRATISLLQRHLKVGYARGVCLMDGLEQRGLVSSPNPNGHRIVTCCDYSLPRHSETERAARSLCDLALTFVECREENIEPHSLATSLCLDVPALKMTHTAAKNLAKKVLVSATDSPVTDLALALGRAAKLGQTGAWSAVEAEVRAIGLGVDRPFASVTCDLEKLARAYSRALRYLDRRIRDGEDPHTRVWDAFVPMAYVPQGCQRGHVAATHPEHVVPCKSLAMEATRLLRGGLPFEPYSAGSSPTW